MMELENRCMQEKSLEVEEDVEDDDRDHRFFTVNLRKLWKN